LTGDKYQSDADMKADDAMANKHGKKADESKSTNRRGARRKMDFTE
jgi:hypothetical protein